MNIKMKITFKL